MKIDEIINLMKDCGLTHDNIYTAYSSMQRGFMYKSPEGKTQAVILEGKAVLLHEPAELLKRQFTWIYSRYVGADHVSEPIYQDWINDPQNTLIKLTPNKIYVWSW